MLGKQHAGKCIDGNFVGADWFVRKLGKFPDRWKDFNTIYI